MPQSHQPDPSILIHGNSLRERRRTLPFTEQCCLTLRTCRSDV